MQNKNIVILGGGFGGLRTAFNLEKSLKKGYKIILIDQNTFHLYTASLYEVAAGELSHHCILLPFHLILKNKKIDFINGSVTKLNSKKKVIETSSGDKIPYWKLVVALGADTEDFGIPGVAKYAIGMKSVTDAEKVYKELLHCSTSGKAGAVKVVIGGGGFTGVEVAGELTNYKKRKLDINIIEAAPKVLSGLPERISKEVSKRLNYLGVRIMTSSPIKEVKKNEVVLASGRTVKYDVLIWTAGVRGSRFLDGTDLAMDKKKTLVVNKYLQVKDNKNIFALGDVASTKVAWTATKAEEDGKIVAHNIASIAKERDDLKSYKVFEPPFIIPIGKRWAIAKVGSFIFSGRVASILKDFVLLYYLVTILPLFKAIRVWWGKEREVLDIKPPEVNL